MTEILEQIILKISEEQPKNKKEFDIARQKAVSKFKIDPPSTRDLLKAYHNLLKKKSVNGVKSIEEFLKKARIRSLSGIAIVTSLTKPFPCPGKCVYCPAENKMPKSYLSSEPAAARALALNFDPYAQMLKRVKMLESNGHPTDKIEYIIKGGTWNSYPLKYQYWFILESFRACNNLSARHSAYSYKPYGAYNGKKLNQLRQDLKKEQKKNEKAKHRIIGLTLETRPDAITPKTIFHMRQMGCTRVELGLQAPDDKILKLIKRGHTVQQFKNAMLTLRSAGFKVDLHFMPDLPGSNANHDVKMYKTLFTDPGLKPDMVKIYPCTVIPTANLNKWLKSGKYKPYGQDALFNALLKMKLATPRYCRLSRIIRDIPANEISAGNTITNLREKLTKELKKLKKRCACLRCREIGRNLNAKTVKYPHAPKLFTETYKTTGSTEYFLSYEDAGRNIVYAFLRLSIPNYREQNEKIIALYDLLPEIKTCAFIRELHTYGQLVKIGEKDKKASQHKGLGKKLVQKAEKIAWNKGIKKIAVISGVGVRDYYRKLGYRKKNTYMIKHIQKTIDKNP